MSGIYPCIQYQTCGWKAVLLHGNQIPGACGQCDQKWSRKSPVFLMNGEED